MYRDDRKREFRKNFLISLTLSLGATYLYLKETDQLDEAKAKAHGLANVVGGLISGVAMEKIPSFIPEPKLVEGSDSIKKLPTILELYDVDKLMIVTSPSIVKNFLDDILIDLAKAGIGVSVYDNIKGEPDTFHVEEIKEKYIANGCKGFLAIGGGSVIDATKAAAILVDFPSKSIKDFKGMLKVHKKLAPIIAAPTTAGTGSEATFAAVISNKNSSSKYPVMDGVLVPDVAILDPDLTITVPKNITAATAFDALTHAIEAYIVKVRNTDFTDAKARAAIKDIFDYLPGVMENPEDVNGREKLLKASYNAGLAFTRAGVGYVHGIAHKVGALYGINHSVAIATILPAVLEVYGPDVYPKLNDLAELIRHRKFESEKEGAEYFISEIYRLRDEVGLPNSIDGYDENDLPAIYQSATREIGVVYPVPRILTIDEVEEVLNKIS